VLEDVGKGQKLTLETKITTTLWGAAVEMTNRSVIHYDGQGRCTSFDIRHEKPTGKVHSTGERAKGGWDITIEEDGKKRTVRVEDDSYDRVSVEKGLWAGKPGTKVKKRVLFAGQGKVKKATIMILDRKTKTVLGEETEVTHFKIKSGYGTVEEWRTSAGIIVKSRVYTPLGKILIKLKD
jgi:hypothetical protein